ncbi:MAG: hypothetical protein N0C91_09845 [Candidatus Thiodiazotropha endolucinida]|nr:hypothetical protein [Candidatus Thiodiazotropha taylori]MCW4266649.1 hypothetical protein [Candidatus Thiodiazotropha endolucinida]MCG8102679.1 hypothetical protein [Candidatus Thiodiazotropha taylori]MCG8121193.1 hypothetical protein [Candidatus Thiodiazotropha taylori]MCW4288004.1 hypothetical protein [Candidatus Thiodiazotropha endolucinida]
MPQTITNDHDLREAISGLSPVEQRALGGQFVANVGHLSQDPRISRAIDAAIDSDISPAELEQIHKTVKAFATQTYTACGSDADWAAQAEHFVAAAAAASLSSDDQSGARGRGKRPCRPEWRKIAR